MRFNDMVRRALLPFLISLSSVLGLLSCSSKRSVKVVVIAEGLQAPIGLAMLADGSLLIAEEGTGNNDNSAGVSLIAPDGQIGRLISGFPSGRDAGDLAGVPLVGVSPEGDRIYIGNFGAGHLWVLPVPPSGFEVPPMPYSIDQLIPEMLPLNNVKLVNPFDITFDANGVPVVSDASGNGVAKENPDGTTRFIHRFPELPNPNNPAVTIESVPTGLTRVGDEYYVALTGGCPYPKGGGQIVAIDENRNQRTIIAGLDMPIDVAQASDGTIWILEFARFTPDASCFDGQGYQPNSGRLSRLQSDGSMETVLDELNFPGAVLPLPDGSLYVSEVFPGRILHITFEPSEQAAVLDPRSSSQEVPSAAQISELKDVAAAVGLDFQHSAFRSSVSMDPVAMMGGGLCWIDYDNDGWLDLYLVNSHAEAETEEWLLQGGLPRNALYQNLAGSFRDVSQSSGADLSMRGNGCVAADFNLDGWWDLYITADGANALLWNNGDGTFREGADEAGVATSEWNTASTVGDLNQDGWPDLFVAAYIDLENKIPKPTGAFPQDFFGLADHLYLNQGLATDGTTTFREVTSTAGLLRQERGLGALLSDLDRDGDLDLYIANDGHPNRLYANEPWPGGAVDDPEGIGFRFVDLAATSNAGDSGSGMGIAGGDYDGDGLIDLVVTNWDTEVNALYRNESSTVDQLTFLYSTYRIGISGFGSNMTGWGVSWLDLDHDTDLDLLVVNGHVPVADLEADAELVRLYLDRSWNMQGEANRAGQFVEWTEPAGLKAVGPLHARGSAAADYDNDGDLDIAINSIGGPVALLQNNGQHGNWLQVSLGGFCPGARGILTLPDGRRLVREIYSGSSYLASEDPRMHFGLGLADEIPGLRLLLPDGRAVNFGSVEANQVLQVDCRN